MKLWLISQIEHNGSNTYLDAVVAANSIDEARQTFPNAAMPFHWPVGVPASHSLTSWASSWKHVTAKELGEALPGTSAGTICANFTKD